MSLIAWIVIVVIVLFGLLALACVFLAGQADGILKYKGDE